MKLELGNMPKQKQNLIAISMIVVIVGVVGWLVYSNIFAGSGGDQSASGSETGAMPALSGPSSGPMPGGPTGPSPSAGAPTAPVTPTAQPGPAASAPTAATPTAAPSAPVTATRSPQPVVAKSAPMVGAKTITIFGSVTVTYPSGWGVGMGSSGSAAVLTDGKARFEIQAPDPKATDAKSIAVAAVTSIAGKASASLPQGELKISGYNAYYFMVGGKRIVGIDSPTRIVLVEYTKGASFSAYSPTFDKMQSELKFK